MERNGIRAPRASSLAQAAAVLALLSHALAPRAATAGPELTGRWTAPNSSQTFNAIHLTLLPGDPTWPAPNTFHSYVLAWRGRYAECSNAAPVLQGALWGWNPSGTADCTADALTGFTGKALGTPDLDIFCSGHVPLDRQLLLTGGASGENNGISASYLFDPTAAAASQFTRLSDQAWARWYPGAVASSDGKAITFGGLTFNKILQVMGRTGASTVHNKVQRLDVAKQPRWAHAASPAPDVTTPGRPGNITAPTNRESHTLSLPSPQGRPEEIVLIGGRRDNGELVTDVVWQLHRASTDRAEQYRWIWLNAFPSSQSTDDPGPIAQHAVASFKDSVIFVMGGFDDLARLRRLNAIYRLARSPQPNEALGFKRYWHWTRLTTSGPEPRPRYDHTAVYDELNDRLLVQGGSSDPSGAASGVAGTDTVWTLTNLTSTSPTWVPVLPATLDLDSNPLPVPADRQNHAMVAEPYVRRHIHHVGGGTHEHNIRRFFMVGGRAGSTMLDPNAVWELRVFPLNVLGGRMEWRKREGIVGPGGNAPGMGGRMQHQLLYGLNTETLTILGGRASVGGAPLDSSHTMPVHYNHTDEANCSSPPVWWPQPAAVDEHGQPVVRTAVASGAAIYDQRNPSYALVPERFEPASGTWTQVDSTKYQLQALYPQMFQLPGGKLFFSGPRHESMLFDPSNWTWQTAITHNPAWVYDTLVTRYIRGGSSVLFAVTDSTADIMRCGVRDDDGSMFYGGRTQRVRIHVGNGQTAVEEWQYQRDTNPVPAGEMQPRCNFNLVLMPDGKVMALGGLNTVDEGGVVDTQPGVAQQGPQLWDPNGINPDTWGKLGTWTPYGVLASDPVVRGYHSTAILLPDARILSAGGNDVNPTSGTTIEQARQLTAFCPPYLFNASGGSALRPRIAEYSAEVSLGGTLQVCGADWYHAYAVLLRPASTTHGFDQNQRRILLQELSRYTNQMGGGLTTTHRVPSDAGACPPGDYLLFLVDASGVPSIARWVKVTSNPAGTTFSSACDASGGGSGGCPFVDTQTASGWQVENSILGRSLTGAFELDGYRLARTPEAADGRYRLRIRENEQETTTLDEVRLVAVDHAPGLHAFAAGERVVLGTRVPAARVTTQRGEDITALVDGSTPGGYFTGQPGDTLLVEMPAEGPAAALANTQVETEDPGFLDDGGDKDPPPPVLYPGDGLARAGRPSERSVVDAYVMDHTGVLVQAPDGAGGWRDVRRLHPRAGFSEQYVDSAGAGPVRLVFVGRHRTRFLGRVVVADDSVAATKQPVRLAQHSRLGDVLPALTSFGNVTTALEPGDTLHLEFEATPLAAGMTRELFLLSRGVYTANLPARQGEGAPGRPLRFALGQNRPNPFQGSTLVPFELPRAAAVRLEVFDLQGRRVRRLGGAFAAGSHAIEWDQRDDAGAPVAPGVYLYRLSAGRDCAERKLIVFP